MSKIKDWLKKSGTYDGSGIEIVDELPFDGFFKHKDYPWFWLYEESVFKRIIAVFELFLGTHYYPWRTQKGLLDLFLFPLISRRLAYFLPDWANWESPYSFLSFAVRALCYLTLPITYPLIFTLELIRFTAAGLFTLFLFPIIALVHGLTYSKTQNYLREIEHLQLLSHPDSIHLTNCELGSKKALSISYTPEQGLILHNEKTGEKAYIIQLNVGNVEGIAALFAMNAFDALNAITPEHRMIIRKWLSTASATKQVVEKSLEPHLDNMPVSIILTYAELASRKQEGQVKASFLPTPTRHENLVTLADDQDPVADEKGHFHSMSP